MNIKLSRVGLNYEASDKEKIVNFYDYSDPFIEEIITKLESSLNDS